MTLGAAAILLSSAAWLWTVQPSMDNQEEPTESSRAATSSAEAGLQTMAQEANPLQDFQWPSGSEVPVIRKFNNPSERWLPGHRGVDLGMSAGSGHQGCSIRHRRVRGAALRPQRSLHRAPERTPNHIRARDPDRQEGRISSPRASNRPARSWPPRGFLGSTLGCEVFWGPLHQPAVPLELLPNQTVGVVRRAGEPERSSGVGVRR